MPNKHRILDQDTFGNVIFRIFKLAPNMLQVFKWKNQRATRFGSMHMNCYLFGSTFTTLDLQSFALPATPTEQTITSMNPKHEHNNSMQDTYASTTNNIDEQKHESRRNKNMNLDETNMNLAEKKKESRRSPNHPNILDAKQTEFSTRQIESSTKNTRLFDGP